MPLSKQEFTTFISQFDFKSLFNEMGWDRDSTRQPIIVDGHTYHIESVGQKHGFKILICPPDKNGNIPDSATRKKIETRVKRLFEEHLIIFQNAAKTEQLWQYVIKQPGRPIRITDTRWNTSQAPELLFQRASGIFFELDEEDNITIVDVTAKIAANFDQNNERVTKKFYERFTKEHKAFADFVTGIDDHLQRKENVNKQWYVSLMLNRLMFCYFIQKKGFLNKDKNYLRNKLAECKTKRGENQYYSFYRDFLLALFHDGLGTPDHSTELKSEIGIIPYLNGGLFDTHELERRFDDIQIDDEAFEKIFDFFDQYEWHLDTRDNSSGREINPDVIGYIFEKYINERAAMGAYYTKEDITDYISKNCILPFLFDETKRNYEKAFKPNGEIWSNLKTSGDEYIYDAVKKGVELPLPDEIEIGVDTTQPNLLERRKDWNKKAPEDYALPTEIWREVVDRRRRYTEAKTKIENGEITEINDFITYNLNIRQFVLDCVSNTADPKLLEHFYKSIAGHIPRESSNEKRRSPISILDPTCGSGAFLFAALNILEELYSACIQRMEDFVAEEDQANAASRENFQNSYAYFRRVLANVKNTAKHPSPQYFVYKSIILNNLYGVDIMKEAVEVAKLRLFLKLVATVDADYNKPNLGLEPLPDIDFNIRAGNTLIGYVSQKQIDELAALLITADDKKKLLEECDIVARAFKRYKEIQLSQETDFEEFKNAKDDLNARLKKLNKLLDRTLFKQSYEGMDYDQWKETHQPFHWFAEFYEIVDDKGGFDVVIGNPPYVEYNAVKGTYQIRNYKTESCGNLFAYALERCHSLGSTVGRVGMIVPLSAFSTDRMIPLIQEIKQVSSVLHLSNFSWRPGKLFEGANLQLSIVLQQIGTGPGPIFASNYLLWDSEARPELFSKVQYQIVTDERLAGAIPKLGFREAKNVLSKIRSKPNEIASNFTRRSDNLVFYRRGGLYWKVFVDFETYSSEEKIISLRPEIDKRIVIAALSSNLWFWYLMAISDCRHLGNRDIGTFPFDVNTLSDRDRQILIDLGRRYVRDLRNKAEHTERVYKGTKAVECLSFRVKNSKPIIDEIDKVLAKYYGFTEEELDFIINYDIKYRMGAELDGDADD